MRETIKYGGKVGANALRYRHSFPWQEANLGRQATMPAGTDSELIRVQEPVAEHDWTLRLKSFLPDFIVGGTIVAAQPVPHPVRWRVQWGLGAGNGDVWDFNAFDATFRVSGRVSVHASNILPDESLSVPGTKPVVASAFLYPQHQQAAGLLLSAHCAKVGISGRRIQRKSGFSQEFFTLAPWETGLSVGVVTYPAGAFVAGVPVAFQGGVDDGGGVLQPLGSLNTVAAMTGMTPPPGTSIFSITQTDAANDHLLMVDSVPML